jgi:hypothetical protein
VTTGWVSFPSSPPLSLLPPLLPPPLQPAIGNAANAITIKMKISRFTRMLCLLGFGVCGLNACYWKKPKTFGYRNV